MKRVLVGDKKGLDWGKRMVLAEDEKGLGWRFEKGLV